MKIVFIALISLVFIACQGNQNRNVVSLEPQNKEVETAQDSTSYIDEELSSELQAELDKILSGGLNKERFADWSEEDWLDNDYIRELRQYVDAYLKGSIKDEDLDSYKDIMQGKFSVLDIDSSPFGGVDIWIAFIENPTHVFSAWVYGDVKEDKGEQVVVEHQVRAVTVVDKEAKLTKEHILNVIKEHPENKLW